MVDPGIAVSEQKLDAVLERLKPGDLLADQHALAVGVTQTATAGCTSAAGGYRPPNTAKHLGETIRVGDY
jgi:hypothetical protein